MCACILYVWSTRQHSCPQNSTSRRKNCFYGNSYLLTCIYPSTCLSSPLSSLDLVPEQLRQRVNPVVLDGNSSGQADVGVRQWHHVELGGANAGCKGRRQVVVECRDACLELTTQTNCREWKRFCNKHLPFSFQTAIHFAHGRLDLRLLYVFHICLFVCPHVSHVQ